MSELGPGLSHQFGILHFNLDQIDAQIWNIKKIKATLNIKLGNMSFNKKT